MPVGLLRRMAAMLYDGLLVLALWMVLGLVFVLLGQWTGQPLTSVQLVVNLLAAWLFFTWFWTRNGQTLGMQAWTLRLHSEGGGPVHPRQATLRYLVALAQWVLVLFAIQLWREQGPIAGFLITAALLVGLGLSQRHPQRLMLHDWLSGTVLVRVPREPRSPSRKSVPPADPKT